MKWLREILSKLASLVLAIATAFGLIMIFITIAIVEACRS